MRTLTLISRLPHLPAASPSPISARRRRFLAPSARIELKPCRFPTLSVSKPAELSRAEPPSAFPASPKLAVEDGQSDWSFQVGSLAGVQPKTVAKLSLSDQAFFLLAFIACTTSVAFVSLVVAAVPTLHAMGRAANSLSKLADTAREELPSTMAAVRLSGMEISDLTMELSDLSQEISDGVTKSAQVVQAAEVGIRQVGSLARQHTISIIQEGASLHISSIQPVVVGAAKKTSRAVGKATKSLMNMISGGEPNSENEEESGIDQAEV